MRKQIKLICTVCLSRNYTTTKNPFVDERFTVTKYCPKCNQHTEHKETR